jgi:hypothetical protein
MQTDLQTEIWIQDLAFAEKNSSIGKLIAQHDMKELIHSQTANFLDKLKMFLTQFSSTFTALSDQEKSFTGVKVYQLAQSATDFMLYRNKIKLVFRSLSPGLIEIGYAEPFVAHLPCLSAPPEFPPAVEIIAQVGPFLEVFWSFQGERVDAYAIAKYHFCQFIQASRVQKQGSSNQVLFDEIKAFLETKGLSI